MRGSLKRVLALAAVLLFVAAACGDDTPSGQPSPGATGAATTTTAAKPEPKPGGSISMGLEAESAGWMPGKDSHSEAGTTVMLTIHDALMLRDKDGVPRPYLAESLTPNDAGTEYTLKLRSGVKFHDGTDLNSAALKEVFDTYLKPATARTAATLRGITMEVVDDLTVMYKLESPNYAFPDILVGASGWPFSPTAAKAKGDGYSASPVGTGPFVFDSWQRDNQLVVKKNPNYWQQGKPYLEQITFRPIPDEDSRLASLSGPGGVDIMHTLRQSQVKKAQALTGVTRYDFLGNNSGSSIFNTSRPPFDDKRFRQALAHAINQEDLIKVLGGEGLTPGATQFFSPEDPFYSAEAASKWPKYDLDKAKELYNSYVNDPTRSDGKPAGTQVEFTYNCPPDPSLIELVQLYQEFWTAMGAKVNTNQVEQATHINNAVGTPPEFKGEYEAQCWRLGGQSDPDNVLFNQYQRPTGNAANVTDFDNATAQELLVKGRTSKDLADRKKAYGDLMVLFAEEVPHIFTGFTASVVVTKPTVYGIDDWKLPDGTQGQGHPQSFVLFSDVYTG